MITDLLDDVEIDNDELIELPELKSLHSDLINESILSIKRFPLLPKIKHGDISFQDAFLQFVKNTYQIDTRI